MERERFVRMRLSLSHAATGHHNPHAAYSDKVILLVLLWAALHRKPISWACLACHWPGDLRPTPLPSQPTMSRRLRCESLWRLLERWACALRDHLPRSGVKIMDAKVPTIGGCGKDPDAASGYGAGGLAKGYKLHWVMDFCGAVDHWLVAPLNFSEQAAAGLLLQHTTPGSDVLADHNYDSNALYELSGERGIHLLAAPPRNAKGIGNRRHSPHRLHALEFLHAPLGRRILKRHRIRIASVWITCPCTPAVCTA
ncbi:MAG: transposase [Planctomycetes bacterium]|nr:transposase [Planctomycetota bacterium]